MGEGILDNSRKTIIELVVKQCMGALVMELPFLAAPPLKWITEYMLSKIVGIALDKSILGLNLVWTDIAINTDVKKLTKLLQQSKDDAITEEERKEIDDAIDEKFADLVRINERRKL